MSERDGLGQFEPVLTRSSKFKTQNGLCFKNGNFIDRHL